jgi:hypothetical protein
LQLYISTAYAYIFQRHIEARYAALTANGRARETYRRLLRATQHRHRPRSFQPFAFQHHPGAHQAHRSRSFLYRRPLSFSIMPCTTLLQPPYSSKSQAFYFRLHHRKQGLFHRAFDAHIFVSCRHQRIHRERVRGYPHARTFTGQCFFSFSFLIGRIVEGK